MNAVNFSNTLAISTEKHRMAGSVEFFHTTKNAIRIISVLYSIDSCMCNMSETYFILKDHMRKKKDKETFCFLRKIIKILQVKF